MNLLETILHFSTYRSRLSQHEAVIDSSHLIVCIPRIYVAWKHACEQVGAVLPKQCITEFNKRIQSCSKGTGKAKLDFRGCSLDDQKVG